MFIGLTSAASAAGPAGWGQAAGIVLALAVAVPIGLHVAATLVLIRTADEFARAIASKRFIVAWGLSTSAFCAWGYLEHYAAAPHAPAWTIYPLFWLGFALVSPFVRSTR